MQIRMLTCFVWLCTCSVLAIGQSPRVALFSFDLEGVQRPLEDACDAHGVTALDYALSAGLDRDTSLRFRSPHYFSTSNRPIQYPVGAMSAAPVCLLVLKLHEEGRISINEPINAYLRTWKLTGKKSHSVTVADVMLMRPKLKQGYKSKGYSLTEALPSSLDIMLGRNGAKNPAIQTYGDRKDDESSFAYWLILGRLLEDVYQEDLPTLMEREVFGPLGMSNSVYQAKPSDPNHLIGHKGGKPIEGGVRAYPELPSGGLWSTAEDYLKLARDVLEAQRGTTGRFLSPETAKLALDTRRSYRSLLFHVGDDQSQYLGGNPHGFYANVRIDLINNYAAVAFANADLVWPVVGSIMYQSGSLAKSMQAKSKLAIFYAPGQRDSLYQLLPKLRGFAWKYQVGIDFHSTDQGVPAELTATPAFVLTTETGRSIYPGRHNDLTSLDTWLAGNLAAPRSSIPEQRGGEVVLRRGRQFIALPLKLTAATSFSDEQHAALYAALQLQLAKALNQTPEAKTQAIHAQVCERADIQPTDRRLYLDVHPYFDEARQQTAFSVAVFSQFNCHDPLVTTFGQPRWTSLQPGTDASSIAIAAEQVGTRLSTLIETYLKDPARGEIPRSISEETPLQSWTALGLSVPEAVLAQQQKVTYTEPLALNATYTEISPLFPGAPPVQFNFPPPLDRYAGTVSTLSGKLKLSGNRLSGNFSVPIDQLTMGNDALDTYVVEKALAAGKHPYARLELLPTILENSWRIDQPIEIKIPGKLSLRGKTADVILQTRITPRQMSATAAPSLDIIVATELDISDPWKLKGPDGPEELKHTVKLNAAFRLQNSST